MEVGIGIAVVVAFGAFIAWRMSQKKADGTGGSGGRNGNIKHK